MKNILLRSALGAALALALAIPFGAGIPTAIKYGAAAALAFSGAGIIQNFNQGGIVAGNITLPWDLAFVPLEGYVIIVSCFRAD